MCSYKGEAGVSESEETCPWEQRCVYKRERERAVLLLALQLEEGNAAKQYR